MCASYLYFGRDSIFDNFAKFLLLLLVNFGMSNANWWRICQLIWDLYSKKASRVMSVDVISVVVHIVHACYETCRGAIQEFSAIFSENFLLYRTCSWIWNCTTATFLPERPIERISNIFRFTFCLVHLLRLICAYMWIEWMAYTFFMFHPTN